jgi:hypothetical protein
VSWRRELLGGLLFLGLLALLSFAHLAWGGRPLARLLQSELYALLGGRLSSGSLPSADPLVAVLARENARLNELLALRARLPGATQAALVTRREPETWWTSMEVEFAISGPPPKGTAVVLSAQGLLGTLESQAIVVSEEGGQAFCRGTVALLSSPKSQLSVVVGESQSPFLLEGRGGASFALRPVTSGAARAISSGEAVQTSGLGKLYSKGLQVAQVDRDTRWATFSALAGTPSEVLLWWR